MPLANEYKKLFAEQHQRLWLKHHQDLDLIDDIRSYVKARLSIEREYSAALTKLAKQHANHIAKKFSLLNQCDQESNLNIDCNNNNSNNASNNNNNGFKSTRSKNIARNNSDPNIDSNNQDSDASDSRLQKRLAHTGPEEPTQPCTLYKVWSEHINRLQVTTQNRAEQFMQLILVVDKLKDIRSHKASIGKKCLDTHLKRIHEDVLVSMVDVDKAKKSYYEDESQAKKARENEEKIKKKRSGILTKFTDLQAKKEKTSAQREANDIQSTQARNDYIMAIAAGNAHLQHYYDYDLTDFIHLIDDGVLDHCKVFMATLSECEINSLKDSLASAQYWSKMINLTGLQNTNAIFLESEQSFCLRARQNLNFEPCNNDPIRSISLEYNADYALQHEIDKWFTWFKKECRNLSQLIHITETCQRAFSEGKKSIEINGQNVEDLEHKIIELKQQIRKSEAAKLKAQARLKVIKDGGMQIEEWSVVESEIRADMARAQENREVKQTKSSGRQQVTDSDHHSSNFGFKSQADAIKLQVQKDSDDSDIEGSVHNLASVSRSASNLAQRQGSGATQGYSAMIDPSLVWQDDYSSSWGAAPGGTQANLDSINSKTSPSDLNLSNHVRVEDTGNRYDLLGASNQKSSQNEQQSRGNPATMTVQSSSPLSAIVDPIQSSTSPYQGMMGEAYKSDYECDYNRSGHMRSTASSAEPFNQQFNHQNQPQVDPFGRPLETSYEQQSGALKDCFDPSTDFDGENELTTECDETFRMLNKRVIALYNFDKTNEDDLAFSENDVLRVTEINDANWVKAKNEATGEEGYVPTSYIRLNDESTMNETDFTASRDSADAALRSEPSANVALMDSDGVLNSIDGYPTDKPEREEWTEASIYCRAVYDYQPGENEYEGDDLPHLSLTRGELMRIIDEGEDDGWWLVEKEKTGEKGHIPSMLVEKESADVAQEQNDSRASEFTDDDRDHSIKAMPTFEPPPAPPELEQETGFERESLEEQSGSTQRSSIIERGEVRSASSEANKAGSSLIPTSFIIIEPTPEIASRCIEDSLDSAPQADNELAESHECTRAQILSSEPPSDVSYVVVNEDFVLEKPTRVPHCHIESVKHETPTIPEENVTDVVLESLDSSHSAATAEDHEPSTNIDTPMTPSVVIDSFEDDKPIESDYDEETEYSPMAGRCSYVKDNSKSENVYVSAYMRQQADDFSKQIIAEAILLAPGTDVGPSTSRVSID